MEPVGIGTSQKLNILSNILISNDTANKENADCQVPRKVAPMPFKNLAFELPAPVKRKNSFNDTEQPKKIRAESDGDVKIFNYLTGTYETVNEDAKEDEFQEDSLEIKEETLLFDDENALIIKEEPERALDVTKNNSIVKDDPIEPLKFEVLDNSFVNNSEGLLNGNILPLNCVVNGSSNYILHRYLTLNIPSGNHTKSNVVVLDKHFAPKRLPDPDLKPELALGQLWEYKCKSCPYIADTKAKLMSHIYNVHLKRVAGESKALVVILCRENFDYSVELKCFDCDSVFDERSELAVHASLIHSMSTFKCDLHCSEKVARGCSKCVYESVLGCSRKSYPAAKEAPIRKKCCVRAMATLCCPSKQSIEILCDEEEVITKHEDIVVISDDEIGDKCLSRDEGKNQFSSTEVKQEAPEEPILNSDSDDDQIETLSNQATVETDENEAMATIETDENDAIATVETNENAAKASEAGHETILNMAESDRHNKIVVNNGISEITVEVHDDEVEESDDVIYVGTSETSKKLRFQCFDCSYSVEDDLPQFKLHVAKHIGSKFRCMLHHPDAKGDDCMKCYYENVLSDNERCPNPIDVPCGPGEVKCFHCPYVTSRNKYLYYHAVDHVLEDFACQTHHANPDACLECTYARCLDMAKQDVLECEICCFKTVIIAVFDVHRCVSACTAPYTCWDCKLDSFKTIHELRRHAVVHSKSEFRCGHLKRVANCSQCLYQALAGDGEFKCFHCEYKTSKKNLLKYHCKEHYALKFACDVHTESPPQVDCPKCIYEKLLIDSRKSLFACTKCSFKTFNGFHFTSHVDKSHSAPADAALPFECFDCADRFKYFRCLKHHAVCHSDSKFRCTNHKSHQEPTCPKCTYESVIRYIKAGGTFTCKKCGYETKLWVHMKNHESDEAHCEAHKAKPVKAYACFDCEFSHERLDGLKGHVREHRASTFRCDQHKACNADCPKCRYAQLVFATVRGRLCCYDCDERKLYVDMQSLRKHVVKEHPKSNFACTPHDGRKNNFCGKCLYQQIARDVVGDGYVKLICWDCDGKLFSRMAHYENHVVYSHLDSAFLCREHSGKNHRRCSKCLYQKLLQRHSIIKPQPKKLTFQCFQCVYSDKQLQTFIRHVHSNHKNSNYACNEHSDLRDSDSECCPKCFYYRIKTDQLWAMPFVRCYECSDLTNKWPFYRVPHLKTHIKEEHKTCSFKCALHPKEGQEANCVKCLFETLVQDAAQKREYRYECFRCAYRSDNLNLFKSHVHQSHKRDSKFRCTFHPIRSLIDCPQCFYASIVLEEDTSNICYACDSPATTFLHINLLREHIVDTHKTVVFICPSHTVKTVNCDKCLFQRRLEIIREQQYVALSCFDCDYTTSKFACLRYHAWKHHRDSQYRCTDHVAKTTDCQKCSYATFVENIRNFTCLGCEKCPTFSSRDALQRHVFRRHKKDFFVCRDEHSGSNKGCAKCFFQRVVRDAFLLQCHECDVAESFEDRHCLKQHIDEHHVGSKFVCKLHSFGQKWDTCSQCCYEELLRVALTAQPRPSSTFKCFDCNYETDKDVIVKWHIQNEHSDSEFTCRTHSSGKIDTNCAECVYENLILQMKEHFVLSLNPC